MKARNPFLTMKHRLQSQINKLRVLEIVTDGKPLEELESQGVSDILSNIIIELEAIENIFDIHTSDSIPEMRRVKGRKLAVVKSETRPAA